MQYLTLVFLLTHRKSGRRTSILHVCAMGGLFLEMSNCREQENKQKEILMILAHPTSVILFLMLIIQIGVESFSCSN
jgi:hypothetical protein